MSEQRTENMDWITRWQRVARRIRVPLGFASAIVYIVELARHRPALQMIAWSLLLTVPGLWLRGFAAGYVKKNRELTVTGPYAYTRNPLYLGSMLIAAGFAVALGSWIVGVVLLSVFLVIYIPVILSEERFLRSTFVGFDAYCERVPRLIPRLIPRKISSNEKSEAVSNEPGAFSFELYRKHREYKAALGALVLYLCLIFLSPYLGALWNGWKR
jgi:protein-S-isoprenylcysteine O-methyltransferase Ste14